jgi:hypothetical protein
VAGEVPERGAEVPVTPPSWKSGVSRSALEEVNWISVGSYPLLESGATV